jgi:phenylalanyl-tRNA synthetase beta subunit
MERKQEPADFYLIKAIAENILKKAGIRNYVIDNISDVIWKSGLEYRIGKKRLATIGRVNTEILAAFDLKRDVYYTELDADVLLNFHRTR